jgi:uncharacterized protein
MKLDNEFTVGVPIGQAWGVLTDLELIAPCMPGAQLTGMTDGVYTGKVRIKVGPVTAEYSGTAQFTEKDDEAYRAVIDARGRDSRGNGNATAVISAQLRPNGDSTLVTVTTNLTIAGRIAQFGSGMIKEVSAKLLGQFVACLESRLGGDMASPPGPSASVTAGPGTASAGGTAVTAASADGAAAEPGPATAAAAPGAGVSDSTGTTVAGSAAPEPAPLDLMSVAGRAVYKRLLPLAVGLVVLAVVIYLIVR